MLIVDKWTKMLFFFRTVFSNQENIFIPLSNVLILFSPKFDGELKIDGEAYIE